MARPARPERSRSARSSRQLSRFYHSINPDRVFGTHTAEERYQTAAGVEADLRRCLAELESHHRIDPFPLGACGVSDRLVIPEKLYGREREINALRACFPELTDSYRLGGVYTGRILKGEKPAELPGPTGNES
jgi:hypothetical protein